MQVLPTSVRIPTSVSFGHRPQHQHQLMFGQEDGQNPAPPPAKKPRFHRPSPKQCLMNTLGVLNNWFFLKGLPVLRLIPVLNDFPLVGGYFKVNKIDIPQADTEILHDTIHRENAVFIGPNHPEFMTDWLLDKYLSMRFAPKMASWAAAAIVNSKNTWLKKFWLNNNVIANNGGRDAVEYSIEQAQTGNGVLLHPEGTVRWNGNYIGQLLPGIVDMAIEAAEIGLDAEAAGKTDEATKKPVFISPVVWKLRFNRNISSGLHSEMTLIEEKLDLPKGSNKSPVAERFMTLQQNVLNRQIESLKPTGMALGTIPETGPYFDRAEAFLQAMYDDLGARYEIKTDGTIDSRIHRYQKAVSDTYKALKAADQLDEQSKTNLKTDQRRVAEMKRLRCFTREIYGASLNSDKGISQEELAEMLKLIRQFLIDQNNYDKIKGMLPKPVGWRTAHIRAVTPINVTERVRSARAEEKPMGTLSAELLTELRTSMQDRLDVLNEEIEPLIGRYRHKYSAANEKQMH